MKNRIMYYLSCFEEFVSFFVRMLHESWDIKLGLLPKEIQTKTAARVSNRAVEYFLN